MRSWWVPLVLAPVASSFVSCKGPMAKIEAVRDGLASDDIGAVKDATDSFPVCKEPFTVLPEKGCFAQIATAYGSKSGFNTAPPDQSAAATVALVLVRERRGDWFSGADTWMGSIESAKGPGPDALRLAVARQMAAAAPEVGKKVDEEKDALTLMQAISGAIPGACATYAVLANVDAGSLPVQMLPDHSPCIQKDLARKEGPGGTYGRGAWRAAAGAVALWKDEARALRAGLSSMDAKARTTVENKLVTIDAATPKIELKRVDREDGWIQDMTEMHGDAGVPVADAGLQRSRIPLRNPPAPPGAPPASSH